MPPNFSITTLAATALLCVLAPSFAAGQDLTGRAELDNRIFDALGDEDADKLLAAYAQLLAAWCDGPEVLPEHLDVVDLVEEFHRRRHELGLAGAPFAEHDWDEPSWKLHAQGRHGERRRFLEAVLEAYRHDGPHVALLWIDLATEHRIQHEVDAAEDALAKAAAVLWRIDPAQLDDRRAFDLADTLHAIDTALLFLARGLVDLAAVHVERGLDLGLAFRDRHGDDALLLDAYRAHAQRELALDRHEELVGWARSEEVTAVLEATPHRASVRKIRLRAAMALVYLEQGDPGRPKEALAELQALAGEWPEREEVYELAVLNTFLAVALRTDRPDEARRAIEEARALVGGETPRLEQVAVAAHLEGPSALPEVAAAFDAAVGRWRARTALDTGQGFLLFDEFHALVGEYVALLVAEHGDEEGGRRAVDVLLRLQSIGSLSKALDAPDATLEAVRGALGGPRHAFLVVVPGWLRSFAVVVDQDRVVVADLPIQQRLEQRRKRLVSSVDGFLFGSPLDSADDVERARRAAGEAFLPPAVRAALAEHDALTVVSVASLGFLPFELLPWDEGTDVGERFAVSYLPSFPVGLELARRAAERAPAPADELSAAIVVALPREAREDGLAYTAAERETLLGDWPFGEARVSAGDEAQRATLGDARDAGLVQIVAHGEYDPTATRPHGLRFADGVLTPELGEGLRLPDFVAVLACQTWSGPLRRGDDGRDHLVGSFFLAGATTQVVSHSRVEYQGGLRLMNETYANLAEGLGAAEALRRARVALRTAEPSARALRWNAALVHCVGLGRRPLVRAD